MALHPRAPLAVRLALKVYTALIGWEERREPRSRQAMHLITDMLLMFDDDTAQYVLLSAEQDYYEERPEVPPVFTDA